MKTVVQPPTPAGLTVTYMYGTPDEIQAAIKAAPVRARFGVFVRAASFASDGDDYTSVDPHAGYGALGCSRLALKGLAGRFLSARAQKEGETMCLTVYTYEAGSGHRPWYYLG